MAGPSVPSRDLGLVTVPAHGASVLRQPPWLTGGAWRKAAGATSPWRRGIQLLSVFRQHQLNNISQATAGTSGGGCPGRVLALRPRILWLVGSVCSGPGKAALQMCAISVQASRTQAPPSEPRRSPCSQRGLGMVKKALWFLATCELLLPPLGDRHVIVPATCVWSTHLGH